MDSYQSIYNTDIKPGKSKQHYLLHLGLFVITFITTTFSGIEWINGGKAYYAIRDLAVGIPYSVSILFILSCHEFGHYFAARFHKVDATLPYFIPFPSLSGFLNFGTMGAVIRTKTPVYTKKAMFDIGIAGPLAGFVACIIVILYGYTHLPGINYLLSIHPDYLSPAYGKSGLHLEFGNTLLFSFFKNIFSNGNVFIPPMTEIYHYPYLCVGWFGLFVTAMNMIPVGQLDGGHIAYTMFGDKKHYIIATISLCALFICGVLGLISETLYPMPFGWTGWLVWALILFFVIKVKHPPINDEEPIGKGRTILGYISFVVLFISFTPNPFIIY